MSLSDEGQAAPSDTHSVMPVVMDTPNNVISLFIARAKRHGLTPVPDHPVFHEMLTIMGSMTPLELKATRRYRDRIAKELEAVPEYPGAADRMRMVINEHRNKGLSYLRKCVRCWAICYMGLAGEDSELNWP